MTLSPNVSFDIASAGICGTLIISRCIYRLLFRCRVHPTCHRRWRVDDAFMALALLPLVGRTVTIVMSFVLNPGHSTSPVTAEEAAAAGMSIENMTSDRVLSRKLLLPGRICYALFLWMLKFCLLAFYTRFVGPLSWGRTVIRTLWWALVVSFMAVVIVTMTECRPLRLAWQLAPPDERDKCSRGLSNLLTMAACNIVTDLALIILPFPMLRHIRLDRKAKFQLSIIFGIGILVVVITILRIPLILISSVSQQSRSQWASTEIICACIVANTAFFYTVVKDLQGHHTHSHAISSNAHPGNFYLQSLPSSTGGVNEVEDRSTGSSTIPKMRSVERAEVFVEDERNQDP